MKKIMLVLSLMIFVFALSSCSVKDPENGVTISVEDLTEEDVSEETETTETTTEESTTVPEETKSTTESTTKAETTKTTTQKEITTKSASKTTSVFTTIPTTAGTTLKDGNYVTRTKTEVISNLRHGVSVSRSLKVTYEILSGGTEKEVSRTVEAEVFDRLLYHADYEDLLPYAKQYMSTYNAYINEVLRLTNEMRAEKGLSPLKLSTKLTQQACCRAEEIAWSGKHSHTRPSGKYFSTIFKENGLESGKVGENIGWNYPTPAKVCAAWKASETHYANIMSEDFKTIGIGVAPDCDSDKTLVWVQHFCSEDI